MWTHGPRTGVLETHVSSVHIHWSVQVVWTENRPGRSFLWPCRSPLRLSFFDLIWGWRNQHSWTPGINVIISSRRTEGSILGGRFFSWLSGVKPLIVPRSDTPRHWFIVSLLHITPHYSCLCWLGDRCSHPFPRDHTVTSLSPVRPTRDPTTVWILCPQ